jgi:hypothetical protein
MVIEEHSPKIGANGWGHLEIEGIGMLKDAKLWPGGGREWDWAETGTRHRPGIQPADVAEVLEHDVEVVVLSRGRELRLEVMESVRTVLDELGVRAVWAETGDAIGEYNRLASTGARVGGLIHSTC